MMRPIKSGVSSGAEAGLRLKRATRKFVPLSPPSSFQSRCQFCSENGSHRVHHDDRRRLSASSGLSRCPRCSCSSPHHCRNPRGHSTCSGSSIHVPFPYIRTRQHRRPHFYPRIWLTLRLRNHTSTKCHWRIENISIPTRTGRVESSMKSRRLP